MSILYNSRILLVVLFSFGNIVYTFGDRVNAIIDVEKGSESAEPAGIEKIQEPLEGSAVDSATPTTSVHAEFYEKHEKTIYVDYGEKVAVSCKADGNPVPFYRWYRRTSIRSYWERIDNDPFAILEVFKSADYVCVARNINNKPADMPTSEHLIIKVRQESLRGHEDEDIYYHDYLHAGQPFNAEMVYKKPHHIRVAYMDATIIVGIVMLITIILLTVTSIVAYCRRAHTYIPVRSHTGNQFSDNPIVTNEGFSKKSEINKGYVHV